MIFVSLQHMNDATIATSEFSAISVPLQRQGLRCYEMDGEALLYDIAHHTLHYLNTTAYTIWRHCDGFTSVGTLIGMIASECNDSGHEASTAVIADTRQALRNLVNNGLVDCVGM